MRFDWLAANWPAPSNIRAGTTLRGGGVSQNGYHSFNLAAHVGDDEQAVAENRRRLREGLVLPTEPVWLKQVHGTRILNAHQCNPLDEADGSWTATAGVVCAVLTADCLPILLCDRRGERIAAVHAGWRGLAAGVIESALEAMAVAPADLLAWIGPGISALAYEVDGRVYQRFIHHDALADRAFTPSRPGHWQCDLYALAELRLRRVGVSEIYGGGTCTFNDSRFFSFRREGQHTGRMATLIWRLT